VWATTGAWLAFLGQVGDGGVTQNDIFLIQPDGTHLTNATNSISENENALAWRVVPAP
jgi:hypothetical protein